MPEKANRRLALSANRRALAVLTLFLTVGLGTILGSSASALAQAEPNVSSLSAKLQSVFQRGAALEQERKWAEALTHYEDALKEIPGSAHLRQRYDTAKIHYDLGRRYHDASFLRSTTNLNEAEALDLYGEVLLKIDAQFVNGTDWQQMVTRGTHAVDVALGKKFFREEHLPKAPPERVETARQQLRTAMAAQRVSTREEARRAAYFAAKLLERELGLRPSAAIFEYTCAASTGLDPYSSYLTEDQLRDVYSQIDGDFVGLGIELKADGGSLLIVSVITGSPAARAGLRAGDRIASVDGKPTADLDTDQAAQILQGREGSVAQLAIERGKDSDFAVSIRRERVEVPSIDEVQIMDSENGIGYLKLVSFQRRTSRDLDAALWQLYRAGMKSLIMDLRGNPGGLLTAAVDIADKFVPSGTIVSTRGRNKAEDFDYSAHNGNTWQLPLIVLIDDQSASASEIFAAAIRDHRRGTVVGQRSYGKGSVQGIFPLSRAGAGLRLTTARFYGPSGNPISNVGVTPNVTVHVTRKPDSFATETDQDIAANREDEILNAALQVARQQLAQR